MPSASGTSDGCGSAASLEPRPGVPLRRGEGAHRGACHDGGRSAGAPGGACLPWQQLGGVPPRVAGHIAGDMAAGSTATATQLTNLILTVISAALQGILKQSASGGEGVDVEEDEGV